jgi:hypothetical protein
MPASISLYGGTSGIQADTDQMYGALKTSWRSIDPGASGGIYRVQKNFSVGPSNTIAANAAVFSMRWTSGTYNAIIWYFKWNYLVTTAFTAQQMIDHGLYFARGFSSNDSGTGSSTLTMSGHNAKKRTSMATSQFGEIRYATSNTLTAGTRTLDSNPLAYRGAYLITLGTQLADYWPCNLEIDQEIPIVLAQNEGLVLNNITVFPAAGVINLSVEVAWSELPIANF